MYDFNKEEQEKAIERMKALKAANEVGRRKKVYRFRPTTVAYVIFFVILVAVCVAMCVRIDRVCGELQQRTYYLEQHVEAIDEWLVEINKHEVEQEKEEAIEEQLVSLGEFELTWYCEGKCCCGQYANGYTATGAKAIAGRTIAVDPKVIPYGTVVVINGHEYVAEDCGGAIKDNRIDILASSHAEALEFGRQKAEVFVK